MSKSKRLRYGPSSSSSSILIPCEELLKEKSSSASAIPEEVVVEIFRRLPLESLHRFKWVSKSGWYPLITREVLPRLIPRPPLLGFFDEEGGFYSLPLQQQQQPPFDPNLPSLHPRSRFRCAIADSRNGLLLLLCGFRYRGRGRIRGRQSSFYLVCNPLTGSWTNIPAIINHCVTTDSGSRPADCMLDFDPWASSPYYRLVTIVYGGDKPDRPVLLHVYDSAAGRWWRRDFRELILHPYSNEHQHQHYTVWDGAAYILCYRGRSEESCLIARFDGIWKPTAAADGTNDDANLEFINFPRGFPMHMPPYDTCIATSGGKLFLANFYRGLLLLRVWRLLALPLQDDDARGNRYEWVMEHEITLSSLIGGGDWKELRVIGFHPVTEAIFILYDGVLFTYHLQSARLDDGHSWVDLAEGLDLTMSLFPFSSCPLDPLKHRNQQRR